MPDETIDLNDDDDPKGTPRAPETPSWVVPAGLGAVLAFMGMATFGMIMCSGRSDAKSEAKRLRGEVVSLEDALELHRSSSAEVTEKLETCTENLTGERATVQTVNTRITVCQTELDAAKTQLTDVKQHEAEAAKKLQEFEAFADRFREMIDAGDLDVVYRRGEMVLKLPAAILFPSAKADLSEGGAKALAKIAEILVTFPERRFTIAGHTDNQRIVQGDFENNWELSTARALVVLEKLIELGVEPKNLIAAGYGSYSPLAKNTTPYGRRANRRIEIILEPELEPLPEPPELKGP